MVFITLYLFFCFFVNLPALLRDSEWPPLSLGIWWGCGLKVRRLSPQRKIWRFDSFQPPFCPFCARSQDFRKNLAQTRLPLLAGCWNFPIPSSILNHVGERFSVVCPCCQHTLLVPSGGIKIPTRNSRVDLGELAQGQRPSWGRVSLGNTSAFCAHLRCELQHKNRLEFALYTD